MTPARIAELLAPFLAETAPTVSARHSEPVQSACHSEPVRSAGEEPAVLSPADLQSISMYIDILLRWNARINLTAIRNEEEIVTRHFGESLFAAANLFPAHVTVDADCPERSRRGRDVERRSMVESSSPKEADWSRRGRAALQRRVDAPRKEGALAPYGSQANDERPTTNDSHPTLADLGSGAGFPGLPIKLWAPQVSVTLIESNHKKATFLREVIRTLTLTDVSVQTARGEMIADRFSVVTVRAVERFESILPVAAALVAPEGRLALLIGAPQQIQAREALPNLHWSEPIPIPLSKSRILMIAKS